MAQLKVIITGATGMVGEGVLLECLHNANVSEILIVNRKHYDLQHPKLKELLVPDFTQMEKYINQVEGYDACFFCAGVSSVGMKEDKYQYLTYQTTLLFAKVLASTNQSMIFTYVSGAGTDSSEKGKLMWARIKGKTENDLQKLPFKAVYNFRPGVMMPYEGQKNWKKIYKIIGSILRFFSPKSVLSMKQVGKAMINAATIGYSKPVLEVSDIRKLANS